MKLFELLKYTGSIEKIFWTNDPSNLNKISNINKWRVRIQKIKINK